MLGEENDLSKAAWDFVGIKKGDSVNVRNAASLAPSSSFGSLSAPARLLQRSPQLGRAGSKPPGLTMVAQLKTTVEENLAMNGSTDRTLQSTKKGLAAHQNKPTMVTMAAACDSQQIASSNQPSIMNGEVQLEASVGQFDGTVEGVVVHGEQHLGAFLDAMLGAGVLADGDQIKRWGASSKWRCY